MDAASVRHWTNLLSDEQGRCVDMFGGGCTVVRCVVSYVAWVSWCVGLGWPSSHREHECVCVLEVCGSDVCDTQSQSLSYVGDRVWIVCVDRCRGEVHSDVSGLIRVLSSAP